MMMLMVALVKFVIMMIVLMMMMMKLVELKKATAIRLRGSAMLAKGLISPAF